MGTTIQGEPFTLDAEDSRYFHKATWLDTAYPDDVEEFPDTLVEGFWLLAMVDAVSRLSTSTDSTATWALNYGLDRVRFISPVHLGQRILPTFEVLDVVPKDGGYKVLRRCTFQVEGAETPAMVADWWGYVLPRGTVERGRRSEG
ncbi:hypothetical protein ABZX85_20120 [Streptomyces sp. NPDC004539]|uniref:hypothetical protein n=1 Tax=Streptomyces sp. NPDC004539 TaxID=3154280 RepID=UPI0033AC76C2